ncbi:hypothetical protein QDS06_17160 [Acinetobacter baumannii]|nr:hypothetical protein [Acinetobacter baumannii]MDH2625854.1 hypothetical protein [Acinetobacter baumannii]
MINTHNQSLVLSYISAHQHPINIGNPVYPMAGGTDFPTSNSLINS